MCIIFHRKTEVAVQVETMYPQEFSITTGDTDEITLLGQKQ